MHQRIKEVSGKKASAKTSCLRSRDGNILTEKEDILNRWSEYIEELYHDERGPPPYISNEDEGPLIHEDEVRKALSKMKSGKASGPDEIPSEVITALTEMGIKEVTKLLNSIYDTGNIPDDLKKSVFIALPQKPGTVEYDQHRTKSLMSHLTKVLLRKVRHSDLFDILQGLNVDGKDLRVIRNLYLEQEATNGWTMSAVNTDQSEEESDKDVFFHQTFSTSTPTCNLTCKGEQIKQMETFKYLGCTITPDAKCDTEIKTKIAISKDTFTKMKSIFTNRNISLPTKLNTLKAYVWPILLYGCECWTLTLMWRSSKAASPFDGRCPQQWQTGVALG
ncbi:uncharacterized protein LOC134776815 [Penaeus indicus]|uniref:uncharacterized protein LOC134776815 n=1 Tax=Penaeus indicus TaxID=29960 RepID=UPI00300CC051